MSAFLLTATACSSAARLGTARTLPPGETSHAILADVIGGEFTSVTNGQETAKGYAILPLPRYAIRRGLSDGLDEGAEFGPWPGVLLDLKAGLVRSDAFDLAISPALGSWGLPQDDGDFARIWSVRCDVLADLNVSSWLSIVPAVGAGYMNAYGADWSGGAPILTGSLGFHMRLADRFAIQPGITVQTATPKMVPLVTGTIGFHFGTQPSFD